VLILPHPLSALADFIGGNMMLTGTGFDWRINLLEFEVVTDGGLVDGERAAIIPPNTVTPARIAPAITTQVAQPASEALFFSTGDHGRAHCAQTCDR
jgi:hypothetical protein